jgi:hypothetical protein
MTITAATLRPLGLGELLDQSIRLYRRNFLKFIGIMALIQVPVGILQLIVTFFSLGNYISAANDFTSAQDLEAFFGSALGFFASTFGSAIVSLIFISGIATAALTRAVADSYLGRPTGILESYQRIGNSWLRLVGAILLAFLLGIGLFIWMLVPCIGWVSGVGILVFFFGVIFPLIAPIVVLERHDAVSAIRRAWELARRRFWWIFGFIVILYLFSQLIITGPSMLVTFLVGAVIPSTLTSPTFGAQNLLSTAIQSGVSLLLGLLYLPLQQTATTLLYFDLRVRTEGFDLAVLAREASDQPAPVEDLTLTSVPQVTTPLITGTEFGYFVVLTLGGIILYALISFILFFIIGAAASLFGGF